MACDGCFQGFLGMVVVWVSISNASSAEEKPQASTACHCANASLCLLFGLVLSYGYHVGHLFFLMLCVFCTHVCSCDFFSRCSSLPPSVLKASCITTPGALSRLHQWEALYCMAPFLGFTDNLASIWDPPPMCVYVCVLSMTNFLF